MGTIAREEVTCEVLMERFQAGDRAALATLVGRHKRALYNFALRLVRSPSAAEDLVQDVFGEIVRSAAGFAHGARFATWMYTLARRICVDHLRRTTRRQQAAIEAPDSDGDTVNHSAVRTRTGQRVLRGVEDLPEELREVYLLREIAHLPFKDIAAVTGQPEDTVKSRMRAALERLRDSLAEREDDDVGAAR